MRRLELGQSIILSAVLLAILLFFILVAVEICNLFLIQEDLDRAAEAAGKAGLVIVGDQIMAHEMESGEEGTIQPQVLSFSHMSGVDTTYLISPPMQTQVAYEVLKSLERNMIQLDDTDIEGIRIEYPASHIHKGIAIRVRVEIKVDSLLKHIMFLDDGVIVGQSLQTIPQR